MDFNEYTRQQWNSATVENSADEAIGKRVWKNIDRRLFRYRTIWKWLAGAMATASLSHCLWNVPLVGQRCRAERTCPTTAATAASSMSMRKLTGTSKKAISSKSNHLDC